MRSLQEKFLLVVAVFVPFLAPLCRPWAARVLIRGEGLVQPVSCPRSLAQRFLWGRVFAA